MTRDPALLPLLSALLLPPAEARRLLARAPPGPGGPDEAAALRAEGRATLLARLDRAGRPSWPEQRRRAAEAGARERARLAELIQRLGDGASPPAGAAPFLLRLARERLATDAPRRQPAAEQTPARATACTPRASPRVPARSGGHAP